MLRPRELRANEIGAIYVVRHITVIATKYDYRNALDRVERLRDGMNPIPTERRSSYRISTAACRRRSNDGHSAVGVQLQRSRESKTRPHES